MKEKRSRKTKSVLSKQIKYMKINHVALITNCIEPNTKSGPITQFTRKYRIKSLVNNLNYLISNSLFKDIYIVDPFMINDKKKSEFKTILKNNGLLNQSLEYIIFSPEKNIRENIIKKGKGYSEVAMLITSLTYMNKKLIMGISLFIRYLVDTKS